ncbi:hypothetical protein V5T82_17065 [Magnetovibrio sp. PR-2]|uniref:hypothetical protein n=1 Tax=Magnetovibrio sp. PR-2 TaxID=3120356 RepID=UPI002FCE148B
MDTLAKALSLLHTPKTLAAIFALTALLGIITIFRNANQKLQTQLIGSLFVLAIAFSSNDNWVYFISIFVVATTITDTQFLEKIFALSMRSEKFFDYLIADANKEEAKRKAEADLARDTSNTDADDVEAVEPISPEDVGPEGIEDGLEEPVHTPIKADLVNQAMAFEEAVITNLNQKNIPFEFQDVLGMAKITSGPKTYLLDAIIQTKAVHYIIEIKVAERPSALINAVEQLELYKSAYEGYLKERRTKAAVQPLIIVPHSSRVSSQFRGIPVVKFDAETKTFDSLNQTYSEYDLKQTEPVTEYNLRSELLAFLKQYSKWGFSPLRIQKWGSKQAGYESFELFSTNEIRRELDVLVEQKHLKTLLSKKNNILYKFASNS